MKIQKIALFLLAGLAVSCGSKKNKVQVFVRPVKLFSVESLGYVNRSFTGLVSSDETSNLGFKMGGQIIKLNVEEGQRVSKGEFIAQIDPIDYQLKLDAAKAAYLNSQSQLDRYRRLIEKQAISQQDYEIAQTNYARDKANYENAVSVLNDTRIYAPFSGIIEQKYVDNYQRVQPTEPVVRLINPNMLEVTFTLPESSIGLMSQPDKDFTVEFENYKGIQFKAKVTKFVDASPDGGGLPVTLAIDDPRFNLREYNVRPGFSCTVNLRVENPGYENVTGIPITAVYSDLETGKDNVWVYDAKTGTVTLRPVKLGQLYNNDMVIVESGIVPGDEIVSAGVQQLVEGEKVSVLRN